jgi:ABC-2 type transport system permease protein
MTRAGTLPWFAHHELRLAWRDFLSLMTAGRKRRARSIVVGFAVFVLIMHALATLMLAPYRNLAAPPDTRLLVTVTGLLALSWSLMLSQAMESVTRAFYSRADLDLVLSSPVAADRLFAVRIAAMAAAIVAMALVLAAPFIDVLAWRGGARWLGAYAVVVSLAMVAVAAAVALTVALFRLLGPKRTRLVAQIAAALIGAAFVIGLQFAAIRSYGTLSRVAILQSDWLLRLAPTPTSLFWWPARACLGDPVAAAALLVLALAILAVAIRAFAPRFGEHAVAAAGVSFASTRPARRRRLGARSPGQALRRKEWTLLLRDPWLMSQSLMQLLYLLPPAYLLWRSFGDGAAAAALLVPVLIMAAGQLAGGLAWLAISGEDAPELVATAPVTPRLVLGARTEAVLGAVALIFAPLVLALAVAATRAGLVAAVGVTVAAVTAVAIQFWFRAQARRSHFRRRQTSSRIATFAEALASIGWAGTGALAAAGTWLALAPALITLLVAAGAWASSPRR